MGIDQLVTGGDVDDPVVDSLNTERLADDYIFAGGFNGSDPSTRLENALNTADDGSIVYLEVKKYTASVTIDTGVKLIGNGGAGGNDGTEVDGAWTFTNNETILDGVRFGSGGSLDVQGDFTVVQNTINNGNMNGIQINADSVLVVNMSEGSITFGSGTSDGLIDSSRGVNVTDNGSNTVGDIA